MTNSFIERQIAENKVVWTYLPCWAKLAFAFNSILVFIILCTNVWLLFPLVGIVQDANGKTTLMLDPNYPFIIMSVSMGLLMLCFTLYTRAYYKALRHAQRIGDPNLPR